MILNQTKTCNKVLPYPAACKVDKTKCTLNRSILSYKQLQIYEKNEKSINFA